MTTDQIRAAFLDFFKSKGHTVLPSSALVPMGDPTLLFVNAGMVQFKDCFLGTDQRPYVRAATSQKCLRISGKHNDLENVGRTARHHTFFEMLGNFSFGDYFKEEAIKFAWQFLTQTLGLSKDRLWVTVYKEDDEARELWLKHTDVLAGRVLRFGKEDNFWAMGDTGPCGPCSEIHYYLGNDLSSQSEEDFRKADGRYIEIWNLVFMQFNRDVSGALSPLPKPSVDTGMGLERIAAVKQGKRANYDADLLRQIIAFTEKLSGKKYLGQDYTERDLETDPQYAIDVALRVIADHVRSAAFLLADQVMPSSDGRGYVLRRLIRRACRHGRVLGLKEEFLYKVASEVIRLMSSVYPELKSNADIVTRIIRVEEKKFLETLDTGMTILLKEVSAIKENQQLTLSGSVAFALHDTYGFPLDMTEDILRGFGLNVDHEGFATEMEKQRERSRNARASEMELILQRSVKPIFTQFVGYEFNEYESEVLGLFGNQGEISLAQQGEQIALVARETPFYAESGGQVGDTGRISSKNATLDVLDTQKVGGETIVHICRVVEGEITPLQPIRLEIEAARRQKLRVNHTATHLLHLALREVLGPHIKQAGSRVAGQSLRFDFTHFEPITKSQFEAIEQIVNQLIQDNDSVITEILPIEEAKKTGAVALFGEKYGEKVRVVQIGSRSREFCGGTHAKRSGDLGVMLIEAEGSISAGVRRIEAVAGTGAYHRLVAQRGLLGKVSESLKAGEAEILDRVERLLDKSKKIEKELEKLGQTVAVRKTGDLVDQAVVLRDGIRVIATILDQASAKQLREIADDLKQRLGSGCIALGSIVEDKAIYLVAVTDNLISRFHAGNLVQEISKIVGGKGGGRADLAQAGGGDPDKLGQGIKHFQELVM